MFPHLCFKHECNFKGMFLKSEFTLLMFTLNPQFWKLFYPFCFYISNLLLYLKFTIKVNKCDSCISAIWSYLSLSCLVFCTLYLLKVYSFIFSGFSPWPHYLELFWSKYHSQLQPLVNDPLSRKGKIRNTETLMLSKWELDNKHIMEMK